MSLRGWDGPGSPLRHLSRSEPASAPMASRSTLSSLKASAGCPLSCEIPRVSTDRSAGTDSPWACAAQANPSTAAGLLDRTALHPSMRPSASTISAPASAASGT